MIKMIKPAQRQDMFRHLSLLFGSKTKAQEILLLLNNLKPVVRHGFLDQELPKIEKFCENNNLHLIKSNFKVLFADDGAYSNKGLRIPESDRRPGMYFVYISPDEEKAQLAAYYEMMQNDKDLGLVLGYPPCCVQFFLRSFSPGNPNPEHKPTNLYTNLAQRENDCVLISHFPCRSDCEKSMAMGKSFLEMIRKLDKGRGEELAKVLGVL